MTSYENYDKYDTPLIRKGTIRLFLGCCCARHKMDIDLKYDKVVEYYETDLQNMGVDTNVISAVSVGPMTAVELYDGPNLDGKRRLVVNPSENPREKKIEIGCITDHLIWEGAIRSFRIWDYEFYNKEQTPKYCNSDSECQSYEYCLCPGGQRQPEWCPIEKRRCSPVSNYIQSSYPSVTNSNLINKQCISERMRAFDNNPYVSMEDIKNMSFYCLQDRTNKLVEGFSPATGFGLGLGAHSSGSSSYSLLCCCLILIIFLVVGRR